jgi:hypothetical protein
MTRATAGRQSSKTARTRVDAGVKELNEMTIGRTDDPENPFVAQAFKAASVFGLGSRTPSGPAAVLPRQQAEHMIAIDPPVRILIFSLASEGPSTHATRSRNAPYKVLDGLIWAFRTFRVFWSGWYSEPVVVLSGFHGWPVIKGPLYRAGTTPPSIRRSAPVM